MNDMHDIIEAFADNEPVDPGRLKDALATADGRDYLVDLLVLRGFVGGDAGVRSELAPVAPPPASRVWRWSRAAAIAAVSVAGGYYAGQRSAVTGDESRTAVTAAAPEPTRVIRLEDSADWSERVAEN